MKRITIKEIARQAGVSVGTVDRVLHDRGEVAEATKALVNRIAREGNYSTNVFARNLKLNKTYEISILLPNDNEYWQTQQQGIRQACEEYESLGMHPSFHGFDRTDQDSFKNVAWKMIEKKPDGVVMAPLLKQETSEICLELDNHHIPFVFVDSYLESTNPLSFIGQHSVKSGLLAAKLMNLGSDGGLEVNILRFTDFDNLNKTIDERIYGFKLFYQQAGWDLHLINEFTSTRDFTSQEIKQLNPETNRWFVPNSRVHRVASALSDQGQHRCILGYDLIRENRDALQNGSLDFLIYQNPRLQGFRSIQALYRHLILKSDVESMQFMPLDILTKENLEFVSD